MPQTYTAKPSDCIESIARKFGFGDFKVIYDHPNNAALRKKRPSPNLLAPGDKVFIPDKELRQEDAATEQKHSFVLLTKTVKLRIVLKDSDGNPFADKKYELTIGKTVIEGNTDGSGLLEQEVDAATTSAQLKLFTDDPNIKVMHWNLAIGHLQPIEEEEGVQARLRNLAFYHGAIDGRIDEDVEEAVKGFQDKKGMEKDGDVDNELRTRLCDEHDKK